MYRVLISKNIPHFLFSCNDDYLEEKVDTLKEALVLVQEFLHEGYDVLAEEIE